MKKILVSFLVLLIAIILFVFAFGKVNIKKIIVEKPFTESNFYKEFYNSDDLILVNVWATWCAPCIAEFPVLEKFQNTDKLKFISFSIDEDSIKLNNLLGKNKLLKERDITFKNNKSLDSIFEKIELSGYKKKFAGIKFGSIMIPYTVLIKNKKILYKANDELDIEKLTKLIEENK